MRRVGALGLAALGLVACRPEPDPCETPGSCLEPAPPVVAWIDPEPGQRLLLGADLTLRVAVSDADDPAESLALVFHSDVEGVLPGEGGLEAGAFVWRVPGHLLRAGAHTLNVSAVDPGGLEGQASRGIEVVENQPPVITLLAPTEAPSLPSRLPIAVLAQASDADHPADGLAIAWSVLGVDQPGLPSAPDASGWLEGELPAMRPGSYTLAVRVTDPLGASASDSVSFEVHPWDGDGDGQLAIDEGGEDCDDADPAVFSGAEERCNGVDDDCDGAVDGEGVVDPLTWYADADGDGFGAGDLQSGCVAAENGVGNDDDCDDARPEVGPHGVETCNGRDDDCDGGVDLATVDGLDLFVDADQDGYGDGAQPIRVCALESGFSEDGADCDDARPEAFPGATEQCGNAVDDDCDGGVDEDCTRPFCTGSPTVIDAPRTIPTGEAVLIDCQVIVRAPLTVSDGVEVRFGANAHLIVGQGGPGSLKVLGGPRGVRFAPVGRSAYAGRISFVDQHVASEVRGLTWDRSSESSPALDVQRGQVEVSDTVLTEPRYRNGAVNVLAGASVRFEDSTVQQGWGGGLAVARGGTVLGLSGSSFLDNLEVGLSIPFSAASLVDETVEVAGNGSPWIELQGEITDRDVHLRAHDAPWRLVGVANVQGARTPTLTLDPGMRLLAAENAALQLGDTAPARLVLDAADEPVLLEGDRPDAPWGHWHGLSVGRQVADAALAGLEIRQAGRATAALILTAPNAEVSDLTIVGAGRMGVYTGLNTRLDLSGATVLGAGQTGIDIHHTGDATLDAVTVADTLDAPLALPARAVAGIGADAALSSDASPWIEVRTSPVLTDARWEPRGLPYRITGAVSVGQGATLTLADGVELRASATGAGFDTLHGNTYGRLVVEGTDLGVTATTEPGVASWRGFTLYQGEHTVEGLDVRGGSQNGNIRVLAGAKLTATRLTSAASSGAGIEMFGAGSRLVLRESALIDNTTWGLYARVGTIEELVGNTLSGNGVGPLAVSIESINALNADNVYTGNADDHIVLNFGQVNLRSGSFTWRDAGVPYRVEGSTYVWGLSASDTAKLTVEAGVHARFLSGLSLACWPSAELLIRGTEDAPVIFEAASGQPDDWGGIQRHNNCIRYEADHLSLR